MNDGKYFNFPVTLLESFLENSRKCLDEIFEYCIYSKVQEYEHGTQATKITAAEEFFGVTCGNRKDVYDRGRTLFFRIPDNTPKTGIGINVFFSFYKNEKTEVEKVTLLAYMALRSIVHKKPFCKVTKAYLFSRMAGKAKAVESPDSVHPDIFKYASRKRFSKLIENLVTGWGLSYYSRYARGFYVSFSLPLEELIFQAEKRRKSNQTDILKAEREAAYKQAMARLKE